MANPSHQHSLNFDFRLKPDLFVAQMGCREKSGNSEVSFESAVLIRVDDPQAGDIQGMQLKATTAGYRVRCSNLPPDGRVNLVLALVTVVDLRRSPPKNQATPFKDLALGFDVRDPKGKGGYMVWGYPDADVFGARPVNQPSDVWVELDGTFTANQQTRKISKWLQAQTPTQN
jgi:hypothetical protein